MKHEEDNILVLDEKIFSRFQVDFKSIQLAKSLEFSQ